MCDSVPGVGPAIQLPLGRTLTQTFSPVVKPSQPGNGSTDPQTPGQPPGSSNPNLGQKLNISA